MQRQTMVPTEVLFGTDSQSAVAFCHVSAIEGEHAVEIDTIKSLFDGSLYLKEVHSTEDQEGAIYYMAFVADDKTLMRVKKHLLHVERSNAVDDEGTTTYPISVGVSIPHGPKIVKGFESKEKIFVNLLSDSAFDLLEHLWGKES